MSDWKTHFQAIYRPILGQSYAAFEESLSRKPDKFLKLTTSRGVDYLREISAVSTVDPLEGIPGAYRVVDGYEHLPESVSFTTGGFYIQNPSSLIPVMELVKRLPENPLVLDVAAAPGGKTVAISDYLKRDGMVIANEPSGKRLKSLNFNLERCGCWNVKTVSADGRVLQKFFPETFDGILLDAPCSNENKIFHHEEVQRGWSPDLVSRMAELQRQLITSAFACLRPGGVLVYSTCTFAVEENEGVIRHILDTEPEAELIDANEGRYDNGVTGDSSFDERVIRVFPHTSRFDGFFIAVVKKKGEPEPEPLKKGKLSRKEQDAVAQFLTDFPEHGSFYEVNGTYYLEGVHHRLPRAKYQRSGLNFMKITKNAELSAQASWEFASFLKPELLIPVEKESAIRYLKGFDIPNVSNYHGSVLVMDGIPVGTVKPVDVSLKNKLDRYFLYGKNITF